MALLTKQQLRERMKALRDSLPADQLAALSTCIFARLRELETVQRAESVFVYLSYRSEVQTHELVQLWLAIGKSVSVPVTINSTRMEAHHLHDWRQLQPDRYGILAPVGTEPNAEPLDLCIAPGLAFTLQGDRLGYGRGHYDRFLASHPPMSVIALAYEVQLVDALPREPTDRQVDMIVTESRTIVTREHR